MKLCSVKTHYTEYNISWWLLNIRWLMVDVFTTIIMVIVIIDIWIDHYNLTLMNLLDDPFASWLVISDASRWSTPWMLPNESQDAWYLVPHGSWRASLAVGVKLTGNPPFGDVTRCHVWGPPKARIKPKVSQRSQRLNHSAVGRLTLTIPDLDESNLDRLCFDFFRWFGVTH